MSDTPKPSATVVVIRDADALEVLLLERQRGNAWVFPGGKIDAADGPLGESWEAAARRAAVREAREEAGLALAPEALLPISRWITPEMAPKRFDTLFFAARAEPTVAVRVDGGEIRGHRWLAPEAALAQYAAREIDLAPPTFVTVSWLVGHARAEAALATLRSAPFIVFEPRICRPEGADHACILYPGDAGYEARDPSRLGPRHRLWASTSGYRYERR